MEAGDPPAIDPAIARDPSVVAMLALASARIARREFRVTNGVVLGAWVAVGLGIA
jgi:hypothetical protein